MLVTIDNRVRLDLGAIATEVALDLKAAFEHDNPTFALKRAMSIPTWGEPRTIRTWRAERDEVGPTLTFPRGGMQRVRDVLEAHGLDWEEVDKREPGVPGDIPDHKVALYKFQRQLVAAGMQRQNCILKSATGSGKTCVGFALAAALKLPTVVIVPKRGLFDQWVRRAERELGMRPRDVGQIGAGRWKVGDLTIAMQKSLAVAFGKGDPRALKLADETALVICDEVHLFAAKTFIDAVDPFRAKYRIGISDDHTRKDRKEFLVHDLFGAVAAEVNRQTLVDDGYILDVEVRVLPTRFEAPWYGMPSGDDEDDSASGDKPKEINFNRLLEEMAVDADRTKLALVAALDEVEAGEQVLLMTHHRALCRKLDRELAEHDVRTGFLVGDANKEFDQTVAGLTSGEIRAAVGTYQAMGTGLDLPRVGVGVAVTPIGGNRQFFSQVRGRLCRTAAGKKSARLYYLWDREVYGDKHLRNMVKWNKRVVVWERGNWVDAAKVLRK